MDWVEKYRPKTLADVIGNQSAVHELLEWAKGWTTQNKPILLYGKPGIGKTSAAYALAHDLGWEIIELNASDQRTKGVIERIAGSSSTTASLTGALRRLILLDEADNLDGNADRGGAKAIVDIIRRSKQPIMLIANDAYGVAPEIRRLCDQVQFRAVPARSLAPHLKYICANEGLDCDPEAVRIIAEEAKGDIRSAVNMLYGSSVGKARILPSDLQVQQKDSRSSIFDLVAKTLSGSSDDESLIKLSREVDDTPDAQIQWLEAGALQHRDLRRRALSLRLLSCADSYLGRTFRRQYYTLWRYASGIMLIGTAAASAGSGLRIRISPPDRWKRMGQARRQKMIRMSLLHRCSEAYRIPEKTVADEYLTPIGLLADRDPKRFVRSLNLDADQLALLIHDKARSQSIIKEIEKAEKEEEKRKSTQNNVKPAPGEDIIPEKQTAEPPVDRKKTESQSTLFSF
ncbi:MAG: Replication factor C large subunit [Methanomicrobiales archaeon 53_19]|jgi:replication factor C large subunit|uniref:replication factor C large subunit n=1 Tax=Methanocalculus sp. TaxID=2004547 RepID=UPI0007483BE8|nr:replication factor C large subunit [Methanocalculus sp.]KUK69307.1 MAG: Replication factor C large subunit [Methanocalculus sp. 52_23]KUL04696.1 MAG: Replication factor C large subunit [Methanomicrobiales archaeon 53_19]HIJ06916.1 replication factor C large subunit [Methanocalculus sp.]